MRFFLRHKLLLVNLILVQNRITLKDSGVFKELRLIPITNIIMELVPHTNRERPP